MLSSNVYILYLMLRRDLQTSLKGIHNVAWNVAMWLLVTIGVKMYVLPYYGVPIGYGAMVLTGAVVAVSNLQIMNIMLFTAMDISENRKDINYDLLLPIPSYLVFIERFLFFAIMGLIMSMFVIPIGKLVFWNHVNLSTFSLVKFATMLCMINLTLAAFAMWLASRFGGVHTLMNMWMRYIFPLWYLGGFEFTWYSMYETIPNFAYITLLNPYIYLTEGVKNAVLGPEKLLSIWICVGASLLFILLLMSRSIWNLRKRLDVV